MSVREPTLFILTAMAEEPIHGYGIIRAVAELTDGRVQLRPGTLYGALDRLREDGHVVVDREERHQGRLRRYYRLTADGAELLAAEAARLESIVKAARRALVLRPESG